MATETFQVQIEAAELYESAFVPALFAEWAPRVLDLVGVADGHRALDVACGTGIVARTAADRIGDDAVVGVDVNEAMLAVAGRVRPGIRWQQADAAALPFADGAFDVVTCQMALMFFPDRARALSEMARVVTDSGVVGLVVPDRLSAQPAYRAFTDIVVGRAGAAAEPLLSAYWSCGDLHELEVLLAAAGLVAREVRTVLGTAHFATVEEFVQAEVNASPLAAQLAAGTMRAIVEDARNALTRFTADDGRLAAPLQCHLVAASPTRMGTATSPTP